VEVSERTLLRSHASVNEKNPKMPTGLQKFVSLGSLNIYRFDLRLGKVIIATPRLQTPTRRSGSLAAIILFS